MRASAEPLKRFPDYVGAFIVIFCEVEGEIGLFNCGKFVISREVAVKPSRATVKKVNGQKRERFTALTWSVAKVGRESREA